MREEVGRILKLVEQGRLKPEEAADLIEALNDARPAGESAQPGTHQSAQSESSGAPPPPPSDPDSPPSPPADGGFFEKIGRIAEETFKGFNWQQIGDSIRTQTQRGMSELRKALDELEREGWSITLKGKHEARLEHQLPFPIQSGQTLRVHIPMGDAHISGGDSEEGRVETRVLLRGSDEDAVKARAQEWTLMIEHDEQGAIIKSPEPSPGVHERIDLQIHVPKGVHVEIETTRGDAHIAHTFATAKVNTISGDIHAEHLRGPLSLQTAEGDAHVAHAEEGELSVDTKRGDIHIEHCRHDSITLRTAHGDVHAAPMATEVLTIEAIKGDIHVELQWAIKKQVQLSTVSGDIHLSAPDGNDCRITLDSISGDIACELPVREKQEEARRWTGVSGEGHGELRATTVSGDIFVGLIATETF